MIWIIFYFLSVVISFGTMAWYNYIFYKRGVGVSVIDLFLFFITVVPLINIVITFVMIPASFWDTTVIEGKQK